MCKERRCKAKPPFATDLPESILRCPGERQCLIIIRRRDWEQHRLMFDHPVRNIQPMVSPCAIAVLVFLALLDLG